MNLCCCAAVGSRIFHILDDFLMHKMLLIASLMFCLVCRFDFKIFLLITKDSDIKFGGKL